MVEAHLEAAGCENKDEVALEARESTALDHSHRREPGPGAE
jgi:hypothetical protein